MNAEKTYFDHDGIIVTSTRFIVASETYAMRNITSVQSAKIEPNLSVPGWLMVIGALTCFVGFSNSNLGAGIIGILLTGAGGYWCWQSESTFAVVLTTSAGEQRPCVNTDRKFIQSIVDALNQSIVDRG